MKQRKYFYIEEGNEFMQLAKELAKTKSLDPDWPTGAVVVKDGQVIGGGWNGSDYHAKYGCRRKELGIATGERYELCEGCHPKNHSEVRAIKNTRERGNETLGSEIYLWGHWWCCQDCWQAKIGRASCRERVYVLV